MVDLRTRPRCTPALADTVATMVRQGATKEAAAQACGIPLKVFLRWMSQTRSPYGAFRRKVLQAEAEAIADAERRVYGANAKPWLQRKGKAASPTRANGNGKAAHQDKYAPGAAVLNDPAWRRMIAAVHKACSLHPELHPFFADAIAGDSAPAGGRKSAYSANRTIPNSQSP